MTGHNLEIGGECFLKNSKTDTIQRNRWRVWSRVQKNTCFFLFLGSHENQEVWQEGNYIVPWKKSFVKITSGNVEKRLTNPKNLKNFRKRPNASNCFRMHPNASQWVRMDPKASKSSRKPQKTCENFEKLRKNFEKLREKFYKNFFHGVVSNHDPVTPLKGG